MQKDNKNFIEKRQEAKENVYNLFTDMMIKRLDEMEKSDWKKPWMPASVQYPRNITGREYNARNALLLMLVCEDKGYRYPMFLTRNQINRENYAASGRGFKKDKDGNKLPVVHILKGEKATPVLFSDFYITNKETKKRISFSAYRNLTSEQQKDYEVRSYNKVWNVFNIDQTNIKEARPELYQKLTMPFDRKSAEKTLEGMFRFEPIDKMVNEGLWRCPIISSESNQAYYSPSKDEIHVPLKSQFKDGELFYGTTLHEMIHSTGKSLSRSLDGGFGSPEYGKEELIAELGSAMVASFFGFAKHIREDSAAYLKSWLDSLRENNDFIKSVMYEVKRSADFTIDRIKKVELSILKENSVRPTVEQMREIGSILSAKEGLSIDDFQESDQIGSHLSQIEFDEIGSKFNKLEMLKESLDNGKYLDGYDKTDDKQVKTAKTAVNLEIAIARENLQESLNKLEHIYGNEAIIEYKTFQIMKEGVVNEQDLLNFGKYLSNPMRKENGIAYNAKDDLDLLTPRAKEAFRQYQIAVDDLNNCKDPNLRKDFVDERENAYYNFFEVLKKERESYGDVAIKTYERVNGPTVKERTSLGVFSVPQWALEYITTHDTGNITAEQKEATDKFIKSIVNDKYEAVVNWNTINEEDKNPAFRVEKDVHGSNAVKTVKVELYEIKYNETVKQDEDIKIDAREEEETDISIGEDGDLDIVEHEELAPDKKNETESKEGEGQEEGHTKNRTFRR